MKSVSELNTAANANSFEAAFSKAVCTLLAARDSSGKWTGELSSSALSTATAVCALAVLNRNAKASDPKNIDVINAGLHWLAQNQNADGGWGDTTLSISNISTTALCWSAFGAVANADHRYSGICSKAGQWLTSAAGDGSIDALVSAIKSRYGKDRTFSVPILMTCVLGNRLGVGREAWKHVHPLPFEMAALPHQVYGALQLPVVSYALPALIAIGQTRFHNCPPRNPIAKLVRHLTQKRTLELLAKIQPENGGFLEAVPLTAFVLMSLASMGQSEHPVATRAANFLAKSIRRDGSWPIDSNLSTWLTTLAINGLASESASALGRETTVVAEILIKEQHTAEHPYTHAKPGGWAWTDLAGGVPDADDTAGAVLALFHLREANPKTLDAAMAGLTWLMGVQNRDGGVPTFCRGWGALPFDRSSPDITAHFIRAAQAWLPYLDPPLVKRLRRSFAKAVRYLQRTQNENGWWVPLWFGNERSQNDENPVYGTSRVLLALSGLDETWLGLKDSVERALQWLISAQNADNGWGGSQSIASSIEETALAVEAIATALKHPLVSDLLRSRCRLVLGGGTNYLVRKIESGEWTRPTPIGFYFAKLWYYERLYPIVFASAALKAARNAAE
ncbi:MAG: shc 2 [Verrucomicrobiales bacterium]|nr:shc 2 [Verrucomicrobiales bacterium]